MIHFGSHNDYIHFFILQLKELFEKLKHCQVDLLIKSKEVNFPSSHLWFFSVFFFFFKNLCFELLLTVLLNELIIPRKLRPILSPPVYDIKHLYLRVWYCSRFQYIIDRMLWMCHPQTLSIQFGTSARFLKVINFLPQC